MEQKSERINSQFICDIPQTKNNDSSWEWLRNFCNYNTGRGITAPSIRTGTQE